VVYLPLKDNLIIDDDNDDRDDDDDEIAYFTVRWKTRNIV